MKSHKIFWVFIVVAGLHFGACNNENKNPHFPKDAAVIQPKYTNLFSIAFSSTDTFLLLRNPEDTALNMGAFCWGNGSQDYGFLRLKAKNRVIALSSVFTGMLEALHSENKVIAVDNTQYISSPRTLAMARKNQIQSVNPNGNLLVEKLFGLKPDLIIGYYIDQKGRDELNKIAARGIPVLVFQNYLEKHPLGRAEWIKVFGALCHKYSEADAQFNEIEEHYLSTLERTKNLKYRPTAFVNAPFSGTWDVPAGNSYMARLLADAGAEYVFKRFEGTGRIPLGIEQVSKEAEQADFWINPGACRNRDCLFAMDSRLKMFAAVKNHQVYNCTKLKQESGANAWWDYGTLRPDLVLLDLFTIFHPEAEWEHTPVFFENI